MDTEQINHGDAVPVTEENEKPIETTLELASPKQPRKKKQLREKQFSNALVIRRETGEKILVPMQGEDNRAQNRIVASMVRDLVKHNIDLYKQSGEALKPKELADLATAAKLAAELSYDAYKRDEDAPAGASNHPDSPVAPLLNGMQALGRGMMQGALETPKGISALMAELDALGKKKAEPKKAEKGTVTIE